MLRTRVLRTRCFASVKVQAVRVNNVAQQTPYGDCAVVFVELAEKKREGQALLDLLSRAVALCRGIRSERGLRVVDFASSARGIEVIAHATAEGQRAEGQMAGQQEEQEAEGARGQSERCFRAQLLLACDGRRSVVRERAGISCRTRDYAQRALVCAHFLRA